MHSTLTPLDSRRGTVIRVATTIVLSGVIFVGTQAFAEDSTRQPAMSKRQTIVQIVSCMRKRMSADKNRSYNEAMKACKDQVNRESGNLPSAALVASDTPPNRWTADDERLGRYENSASARDAK
jgi:hypothetical protein